jgi:tetratricopeptide (TPR) repeat protein
VAVVLYLVFGAGLPYWLLFAAIVPLLLEAPFVSTGVRSLRRFVGGGGPRIRKWSRWAAVLGTTGVLVAGVGSSATVALGRAGVGPLSTLVSQGALPAQPLLVVADFESPADDPELGTIIAGSLRDYWVQAEAFEVVDQERMREYLLAMGRDPVAPVDRGAADEIAERAGAEAVVVGAVSRVGTAYEVGVRVIAAPSGDQLLADREPAPDVGGILAARDRLMKRLARVLGEPLTTVRTRPAPMQVTTSSIEALRLFEAQRAIWLDNRDEAMRMLEQALELDPGFTMARAVLAKFLTGSQRYREAEEHLRVACADRLTMVLEGLEGDLHTLNCLRFVDDEPERARVWAKTLRERYPDSALVVYTNMLMWDGDWFEAAESGRADLESYTPMLKRQELDPEGDFVLNVITLNLYEGLLATRQFRAADSLVGEWNRTAYAERAYDRVTPSGDFISAVTLALARGRTAQAEVQATTQGLRSTTPDLVRLHSWYRGDSAAAREVLEAFAASTNISAQGEDGLLSLARWWTDAERPDRARELIEQYESRFPEDSRDRLYEYGHALAGVARTEGRLLDAVALLRQAYVERSSETTWDRGWDTFFEIGRVFDAAAMPDSAIPAYERAIAFPGSPNDYLVFPLATERLAELYDARGDTANALEHYRTLAHVWKDADPELQPRVAHARERIAALGR